MSNDLALGHSLGQAPDEYLATHAAMVNQGLLEEAASRLESMAASMGLPPGVAGLVQLAQQLGLVLGPRPSLQAAARALVKRLGYPTVGTAYYGAGGGDRLSDGATYRIASWRRGFDHEGQGFTAAAAPTGSASADASSEREPQGHPDLIGASMLMDMSVAQLPLDEHKALSRLTHERVAEVHKRFNDLQEAQVQAQRLAGDPAAANPALAGPAAALDAAIAAGALPMPNPSPSDSSFSSSPSNEHTSALLFHLQHQSTQQAGELSGRETSEDGRTSRSYGFTQANGAPNSSYGPDSSAEGDSDMELHSHTASAAAAALMHNTDADVPMEDAPAMAAAPSTTAQGASSTSISAPDASLTPGTALDMLLAVHTGGPPSALPNNAGRDASTAHDAGRNTPNGVAEAVSAPAPMPSAKSVHTHSNDIAQQNGGSSLVDYSP
jgi:hypothetical protein